MYPVIFNLHYKITFQITKEIDKNEDKSLGQVLLHLKKDFKRSYSDPYVRKLCLWWAFAFGAYVQVDARSKSILYICVERVGSKLCQSRVT